jgi:predicted metal-dependent phosphoesterase TrpH
MKADLHVHTWHSSQSGSLKFLRSRDCYSDPEAVYRIAKARGMDVVTITDHDSIGGCLAFLERHPDATDFIVGEEVSCRFPDGDIEVHLGVYGTTEQLHRELQPLRRNVFDVIALLRERDVLFALNHLLFFYRGQAPLDSYLRLVEQVPALEARNGTMSPDHNTLIEQTALGSKRLAMTAGSDAHTLRRVGTTFVEVTGARTTAEFLQGLRDGRGRPGGWHGDAWTLAGDIYGVVGRYVASLVGFGPADHSAVERLAFGGFSVVSAPFQFLPVVAAVHAKSRERAWVSAAKRALETRPASVPQRAALES